MDNDISSIIYLFIATCCISLTTHFTWPCLATCNQTIRVKYPYGALRVHVEGRDGRSD